jgi:hypothetical protein
MGNPALIGIVLVTIGGIFIIFGKSEEKLHLWIVRMHLLKFLPPLLK